MSTNRFTTYVGIDYSGADTSRSRQKGLKVYMSDGGEPTASRTPAPRCTHWTRLEVEESTHAGLPHLAHIFRRRFPSPEDAKRDDTDAHDAYAVARWLRDADRDARLSHYLDPPLTRAERDIAKREGWILGVT